MDQVQTLLSLPLGTTAVLVAGFLGYRLAFIGRDKGHNSLDVLFISLSFALVARLVSDAISPHLGPACGALSGIAATLAVSALWRVQGSPLIFNRLRKLRINTSDSHITAWDSVRLRQGFWPAVLVIQKTDGTLLMCHKPENYSHLKNGPYILGEDGSVALFVTDRRESGQDAWVAREVFDPDIGYEMTYIPADQVSEIRVHIPS